MNAHHIYLKCLFLLIVSLTWLTLTTPVFAAQHVRPIIDDQLHLLSTTQRGEIVAINRRLAKLTYPQQIWVFTLDKTEEQLDQVQTTDSDPIDVYGMQDTLSYMPFSFQEMSDETNNGLWDHFVLQHYPSYNLNDIESPSQQKQFEFRINMIIMDPKLKYPVMLTVSEKFKETNGDVRNLFLTHQVDFHTVSGENVVNIANRLKVYSTAHLDQKKLDAGVSFDTLEAIGSAILLYFIIRWIHRWYKHHPPLPSSHDDGYDSGYLDGYDVGLHDHDDHDSA